MVTTKWAYHRERSFASNYFIFLKVKEPLINNWFNVPTAQTPIFVLFLSAGVLFDGSFSLWVSLNYDFRENVLQVYCCLACFWCRSKVWRSTLKVVSLYVWYIRPCAWNIVQRKLFPFPCSFQYHFLRYV